MHNAGPFGGADLLPRDDLVFDPPLRRQIVKRTIVAEPDQTLAGKPVDYGVGAAQYPQRAFFKVVLLFALTDQRIGQAGMDRRSHIRGQRPRGRGPDQQGAARLI